MSDLVQKNTLFGDTLLIRDGTHDDKVLSGIGEYISLGIQSCDVVLDIGAHLGAFTNLALNKGASKVVGYEPHPDNLRVYRANYGTDSRVCIYECAVSDKIGTATLWVAEHKRTYAHSLEITKGYKGVLRRPIQVESVSWETAFSCDPHIIKIDIEGSEFTLAISKPIIPISVRSIAIEFHLSRKRWLGVSFPAVKSYLAEQGFTLVSSKDASYFGMSSLQIYTRGARS